MTIQKVGLDFFPLNVNLEQDDKFALVVAKHGIIGFAVLIKMYSKIYADKGYYYEWNEDTQLLFSSKIGVEHHKVLSVIADSIKWKIFSEDKFKQHGILTSARIQKTYLDITSRRLRVEMLKTHLLLDGKNVSIINKNVNIISQDVDILNDSAAQSKVKESKVKNSKELNTSCPRNSKKEFLDDSQEIILSKLLFSKILARNPEHKEPDFQKWAYNIDLMVRKDNRNFATIAKVIEWCQEDNFWQNNILSTGKLREQYDQLILKMNKKTETDTEPKSWGNLREVAKDLKSNSISDLFGDGVSGE